MCINEYLVSTINVTFKFSNNRRCGYRDETPSSSSPPLRNALVATEGLQFLVKRTIDVTGASLGLLLLSPVLWIIVLLIRLDSPGPILFRQVRRGYRGNPF